MALNDYEFCLDWATEAVGGRVARGSCHINYVIIDDLSDLVFGSYRTWRFDAADLESCEVTSELRVCIKWTTFNIEQPPSPMRWQMRCVLSLPYLLAATAYAGSSSHDGPPQAAFYGQPDSPAPKSDLEQNFSPPNPNSTHHLIFNSVSGLLHRWPNIIRRNGATYFSKSTTI